MKERRPLILVSNDDGVTAKGLNELISYIRVFGDVVVVAPDSAQSGKACAVSASTPIHYREVHKEEGLEIYACSGTPVDCVKLAKNVLLNRNPDLLVSGINHGDNSAVNVHYSGTVGAAIEGCISAIPSLAFSLCNHDADADFSKTKSYIQQLVQLVLKEGLPQWTCLNVNFPEAVVYRGLKVCEQATGRWVKELEPCPRTRDKNYYWLSGNFQAQEPDNDKTDFWALHNGYVAITPITVEVTAHHYIEKLSDLLKA